MQLLLSERMSIRDDRMSIFGEDLTVPDFSQDGIAPVFNLRLKTQMCTPERLAKLRDILQRHAGPSPVVVTLEAEGRVERLALSEALRVRQSSELISDLKASFNSHCV